MMKQHFIYFLTFCCMIAVIAAALGTAAYVVLAVMHHVTPNDFQSYMFFCKIGTGFATVIVLACMLFLYVRYERGGN